MLLGCRNHDCCAADRGTSHAPWACGQNLRRSGAWHEMLERGTAGDQTREVVELLGVLVSETEGQLQPVAVRLLLESGDGMQIAVQARGFRVFALLQIEHGAVEDLRQHVPTAYDQGSLLERQSLDDALLSATGQPQLPLTATCRLCGRCRLGPRLDQRLRRRRRCGPGRNDFRP